MIKIVSVTLEEAYKDAAFALKCSVTELNIEVVQSPSGGFLGLFKKSAIIVAAKKSTSSDKKEEVVVELKKENKKQEIKQEQKIKKAPEQKIKQEVRKDRKKQYTKKVEHTLLNDTIMPESFVSTQDDEDYDMADINYTADYDEETRENTENNSLNIYEVAKTVNKDLNNIFNLTCFKIDKVDVSVYNRSEERRVGKEC